MILPFQNIMPFIGVVQHHRDDEALVGRCKVRCFGIHPPADDENVPTDLLPWAIVLSPGMGRIHSPDPKPGEWVFGFFLDGRDAQFPLVLGVIPGHSIGNLNNPFADKSTATISGAGELATAPQHNGVDLEATYAAVADASLSSAIKSADGTGITLPGAQLTVRNGVSMNA